METEKIPQIISEIFDFITTNNKSENFRKLTIKFINKKSKKISVVEIEDLVKHNHYTLSQYDRDNISGVDLFHFILWLSYIKREILETIYPQIKKEREKIENLNLDERRNALAGYLWYLEYERKNKQ